MLNKNYIKICDYIIDSSFIAIIFFVPIIFAFLQGNYSIFELNKLILFRIFLLIIFLAYIAKIFIYEKIERRINSKLFTLLLLTGLFFFFSTIFSIHPWLSFWGSYGRQQGFYSIIHYLLFLILFILSLTNWKQINRIIIAIMLSSGFVCVYGLMQYFIIDPLKWKEGALYTGRIFSSLGQPNFLGQYLIMVIPFSFFSFFFITRKIISRFCIFILIIAQFACLIFTYSRAAWLGLLISFTALIIFLFYINIFGNKRKKAVYLFISFILLFFIIIFSLNFLQNKNQSRIANANLVNRVKSAFNVNSGSNKIRIYYWQAALNRFKSAEWNRKLFGFGPEVLSSIFVSDYNSEWGIYEKINTFPDRAHNLIFDIVLQFGLAGLGILICLYGYIIFLAFRSLKYNKENRKKEYWLTVALLVIILEYFINNLFSFSLTVGYIYFYITLGILFVIVHNNEKIKEFSLERFNVFGKWTIYFALLLVCAVFIFYYNINFLRADCYYMNVKKAEKINDCRIILEDMKKAISLNPISVFYKERYIYHGLNCFEALDSIEDKIELHNNIIYIIGLIEPSEYQFSILTNIAHAKSIFGYHIDASYYNEAEQDYNNLIKINPYITTTYKDLGRMKLWQKEYDLAIANFIKSIELLPSLNSSYLNNDHKKEIKSELTRLYEMIGMAYNYKKDWNNALYYYEEALNLNPNYLSLYKKIADIYYLMGDLDKAIGYNKRGMMLNPKDYTWPYLIALLYQENGEKNKALEYVENALKLMPESEDIKNIINDLK